MSVAKCPGQDSAFLKADDIAEVKCPACGQRVEFWPDELMRKCPQCGRRLANPENSMTCLSWCRNAAQCLAALREPRDGVGRTWGPRRTPERHRAVSNPRQRSQRGPKRAL